MKFYFSFLIFTAVCYCANAANIVAVWPSLDRGHFGVGLTFVEKLAEVGHTITMISPYQPKVAHENIKFIKLVKVAMSVDLIKPYEMLNFTLYERIIYNIDAAKDKTDFVLSDDNFKTFLKTEEKFDLLILDIYLNDALLGMARHFNIPVIAFGSDGTSRWSDEMVKNPVAASTNPNKLLGFPDSMNFFQRITNSFATFVDIIVYHYYYIPSQEALFREFFADLIGKPLPRLIDLIHNVDLVMVNSHPITHFPKAHAPNSIEVGGIHLRSLDSQVQPEFFNTMDRGEHGIIYISLGTTMKSSELPPEKLDVFVKVLNSFENILILWKYEAVDLKERQPNNAIIGPWLPQQEILKHKNLRAFITQGGLLSTMEALHYAKPVIGMPFFNDQKLNMARVESQGYGLTLDYDSLSVASLSEALDKIFNDTSYRENAEKLSAVFKDNPIAPIDKAVHYVEHVIRNNGAAHLRTAATKLSFWQIHLIDQFIFVLAIILFALYVLSSSVKWVKSLFQKRGKTHPIKSSKRNKFKSN